MLGLELELWVSSGFKLHLVVSLFFLKKHFKGLDKSKSIMYYFKIKFHLRTSLLTSNAIFCKHFLTEKSFGQNDFFRKKNSNSLFKFSKSQFGQGCGSDFLVAKNLDDSYNLYNCRLEKYQNSINPFIFITPTITAGCQKSGCVLRHVFTNNFRKVKCL